MTDFASIPLSEACDLHSPEQAVGYIINWCEHEAERVLEEDVYHCEDTADRLRGLASRLNTALNSPVE